MVRDRLLKELYDSYGLRATLHLPHVLNRLATEPKAEARP